MEPIRCPQSIKTYRQAAQSIALPQVIQRYTHVLKYEYNKSSTKLTPYTKSTHILAFSTYFNELYNGNTLHQCAISLYTRLYYTRYVYSTRLCDCPLDTRCDELGGAVSWDGTLPSLRMDPTRAAAVFKRNSQLWTLLLVLINHLIHPDTFVEDPMIPQLFPPAIVTLLRDEGGSHPLSSTDQLTTNQPEC